MNTILVLDGQFPEERPEYKPVPEYQTIIDFATAYIQMTEAAVVTTGTRAVD